MKRHASTFAVSRRFFLRRSLAAGVLASGAAASTFRSAEAADASTEKTESREGGYRSLFDGKTLDGWHAWSKGRWQVEEGTITGEQNPPGRGGVLLSDEKFGDFDLLIDIKPDWGIDSGLFVRSTERGQAWQVAVDYIHGGYVGQIYGQGLGGFNTRSFTILGEYEDPETRERLTGLRAVPYRRPEGAQLDYAVTPEAWLKAWKLNQWNTLRVRVVGQLPEITTWLNGTKLLHFNTRTYNHPRYDPAEAAKIAPRKGSIGLQVHGGVPRWRPGAKCRWKNIRIRPLS
jgi:hypothetical protein